MKTHIDNTIEKKRIIETLCRLYQDYLDEDTLLDGGASFWSNDRVETLASKLELKAESKRYADERVRTYISWLFERYKIPADEKEEFWWSYNDAIEEYENEFLNQNTKETEQSLDKGEDQ